MDGPDAVPPDPFFLQQFSCAAVQCALLPPDSRDGQPHVCSFVVPRQSYLYHHLDVVRETLGPHLAGGEAVWCSFGGDPAGQPCVPLPVQHPVSVLQDIVAAHAAGATRPPGVLLVRIHATEPPEGCAAVGGAGLSPYQAHRHALKQGIAFRYGTVAPLLRVEARSPSLERGLFWAVRNNEPRGVWRARCALQRHGDAEGHFSRHGVVLHVAGGPAAMVPVTNTGQRLGLFLREHYAPLAALPRDLCVSNLVLAVVFVGGLQPLCSTPMDALLECFTSVDLLLHIVVRPPDAARQFVEGAIAARDG